jgi:hypothetical protein
VVDINWDNAALEDLLNSPTGLVGEYLEEKAEEAVAIATAAAPLQTPRTWSWGKHSSSYMPRSFGYLKGNIRLHTGYTKGGTFFTGVNAPYGPTLFLEQPARQLHHAYPFLSAALYAVTV